MAVIQEELHLTNIKHLSMLSPEEVNQHVYTNCFTIMHLNICSLVNKFENFELFLASLKLNLSCIVISESWFSNQTLLTQFHLNGFNMFCSSRDHERGGGVCVYVSDRFETGAEVVRLEGSEALHLSLTLSGRSVLTILAVYRAPSGSVPVFLDDLGGILDILPSSTIVAGDINIDLCPENDHSINFSNYEALLTSLGYYNTILSTTRFGNTKNSILDHILTNIIGREIFSCTVDIDLSDHLPILTSFKLVENFFSETKISQNMFKTNYYELKAKLENFKWEELYTIADINDSFNYFAKTLIDLSKQSTKETPRKNTNPSRASFLKPWMTIRLFRLIKKRSKLHIQFKREPFNSNLAEKYRKFRNFLTNEIKSTKTQFYNIEYEKCRGNVNEKWKFVNKILKGDFSSAMGPTELNIGNKVITDLRDISEAMNSHFVNIGNNLAANLPTSDTDYTRFLTFDPPLFAEFHFHGVLEDEILNAIDSLHIKKATGIDKISARMLKENKMSLLPVLTYLINNVISSSTFPDNLKIARVTPLFKKGSKSDPNNYRPISILSVLSKLIEKILTSQVRAYMENLNLFTENQHGFREKRNTTGALNCLLEKLYHNLDTGKVTHGLFLDFSKAFDTVNHDILLGKLKFYNFSENSVNLLKSYLSNRMQCVKINNVRSTLKDVSIGVPQGSILGPLLFLIFINDLVKCSPALDCIIFADDTSIFSTDPFKLKSDLKEIEKWCLSNKLILNCKKTILVSFKNPTKISLLPKKFLSIENYPVSVSNQSQFLGVTLDENISFAEHIKIVCRKLNVVNLMMKHLRRFVDRKMIIDVYYTFFYPLLIYGLEFWGHAGKTELNKILLIQKKSLRIILCLKNKDPVSHNFSILKIMPIKMLFEYRLVMHFVKTLTKDDLKNMLIDHQHNTRLKDSSALRVSNFKTNKGQRSLLFAAATLFNNYLKDLKNLTPGVIKTELAVRLWERYCLSWNATGCVG